MIGKQQPIYVVQLFLVSSQQEIADRKLDGLDYFLGRHVSIRKKLCTSASVYLATESVDSYLCMCVHRLLFIVEQYILPDTRRRKRPFLRGLTTRNAKTAPYPPPSLMSPGTT